MESLDNRVSTGRLTVKVTVEHGFYKSLLQTFRAAKLQSREPVGPQDLSICMYKCT